MVGFPEYVLFFALVMIPISCLVNWNRTFRRLLIGQPILPSSFRRNVSWGLVDLGVVVLVFGGIAGIGVTSFTSWLGVPTASDISSLPPDDQAVVFLVFGTATLIGTALCLGWMAMRYQLVDGFSARHLKGDITLGVRAFTMLMAPVALIQLTLTQWFPTKHPLIELLRESNSVSFLPVAAFAAVISAPLFEEVFFRLLLQGWLEKLTTTMRRNKAGLSDKSDYDATWIGGSNVAWPMCSSVEHDTELSRIKLEIPHAPPSTSGESSKETESNMPVLWGPILISSALFSLSHLGHGPDWIPLFFLAIGLGYVYQRTRRIQACIVVHMLVNGLGVFQLWSAVRQP